MIIFLVKNIVIVLVKKCQILGSYIFLLVVFFVGYIFGQNTVIFLVFIFLVVIFPRPSFSL